MSLFRDDIEDELEDDDDHTATTVYVYYVSLLVLVLFTCTCKQFLTSELHHREAARATTGIEPEAEAVDTAFIMAANMEGKIGFGIPTHSTSTF